MTEAEWLACEDPDKMIRAIVEKPSDRKLLLLNAASCRRIWSLQTPCCHRAVEVTERYADGVAGQSEYEACWGEVDFESRIVAQPNPTMLSYAVESVLVSIPPTVASLASTLSTATEALAMAAGESVSESVYDQVTEVEREASSRAQAGLLRDIFGNPFRPVAFPPSWRTETVVSLAAAIFAVRAFDRMPILADALEEAGCDHADVLAHCRGPGLHVRGCWVVDGVLGKS